MATGFCPALLRHINDIAGENAPSRKMHVAGFLAMTFCCQNSSVSPLNDQYNGGHQTTMTVKYRKRPTLSSVQTTDDCTINAFPGYLEWTVPALSHASYSFFISDDQISKYCEDASRMVRVPGTPPTQAMNEVYDLIIEGANIVLKKVNQVLVTKQATEFGTNASNGSSSGKFININQDGNKLILDNGIVEILQDMEENEICGDVCIVGGGLFSAYTKALAAACCNTAGFDASKVGIPRFFFDKDTQTVWGDNTIGVFAPGSVKFLGRNKFVGSFAGDKGTSHFMTLPLPVNEFGCADDCLRDLLLDLQLKYYDCPFESSPGVTQPRGWQAIISKDFSLWTQPDTAFNSGDELEGTNGTLKYFIGNSAYAGSSYTVYGAHA